MWSIVPPIYIALFAQDDLRAAALALRQGILAAPPGEPAHTTISLTQRLQLLRSSFTASGADPRLLLACLLSTIWGCRLTYNFWRKGGYSLRFEDYRWPVVRKIMPRVVFEIFNLVFVALAQHLLCLAITLPAFVAKAARGGASNPPPPFGAADWAAAAAFALLLLGETLADEQQWHFHRRKQALLAAKQPRSGDFRRGFLTTGFFRFTRHPSWFCEYGMWCALYMLCAALPSRCALGPAAAGAAGLVLLFHAGSIWITERISLSKYPAYADYQRTTSAIIPWLPGPPLRDEQD